MKELKAVTPVGKENGGEVIWEQLYFLNCVELDYSLYAQLKRKENPLRGHMETDLPSLSFKSLFLRYNLYKINCTRFLFNEVFFFKF